MILLFIGQCDEKQTAFTIREFRANKSSEFARQLSLILTTMILTRMPRRRSYVKIIRRFLNEFCRTMPGDLQEGNGENYRNKGNNG